MHMHLKCKMCSPDVRSMCKKMTKAFFFLIHVVICVQNKHMHHIHVHCIYMYLCTCVHVKDVFSLELLKGCSEVGIHVGQCCILTLKLMENRQTAMYNMYMYIYIQHVDRCTCFEKEYIVHDLIITR